MKIRTRKRVLDWRCRLPLQFVKETQRALAEATGGKLTANDYGPFERTAEERARDGVAPTGRKRGSPGYARLTKLDVQAIYDRCADLGLSIEHAQRLGTAKDQGFPQCGQSIVGHDVYGPERHGLALADSSSKFSLPLDDTVLVLTLAPTS